MPDAPATTDTPPAAESPAKAATPGKKRHIWAERTARMNEKQSAVLAAFNALPDVVDAKKEWDWIGSHPLMLVRARGEGGARYHEKPPPREPGAKGRKPRGKIVTRVKLTVKDIMGSPNGPAPSKRAVIQLQHWVTDVDGFMKHLMTAQRKQQDEGDDKKAMMKDEGLEEVERLLLEFTGQFMGV